MAENRPTEVRAAVTATLSADLSASADTVGIPLEGAVALVLADRPTEH